MSNPELKKQLQVMIQKAARSLSVAQQNFDGGDYDFASSRAYYAAFYSMETLLLTKNLSYSKHSAVISAINQYFIKVGLLPGEFGKLINRLFRERQIGDYDYDTVITKDDAQKDIETANIIVEAIKAYLMKEKFL